MSFIISRLPFKILYFFSGILRFLLQYVVRYRRQVTIRNLSRSFPDKSKTEIRQLMSRYYQNLADIILEVIKLENVKKEEIKERFQFEGIEIMEESFKKGKSVIVAIGHCGNWEWMGTVMGMTEPVKGYAIIKPLSEKRFHHYLELLRHRFNPGSTIDFHHTYRNLVRNMKTGVTFNVFAADQTPTKADINHWATFLNQETPFYTGVEKLARSLDFTVVFIEIVRTGRGKYTGIMHLISDNPKETGEFEITEKYIRLLESSIRRQPDNWLWSHRRWKFERNPIRP